MDDHRLRRRLAACRIGPQARQAPARAPARRSIGRYSR